MEVGNVSTTMVLCTKKPFVIQGYYSFLSEDNISTNEYAAVLKQTIKNESLNDHGFAMVHIMYNYKESLLIPKQFFKDDEKETICSLMFGEEKDAYCFSEDVQGREIKNIYRVPEKVYSVLNELFPKNSFSHSTSYQIQNELANVLFCVVYQKQIKVLLQKNNEFMFAQYFDYSTPLDVCYHLLNVCERFEIATANIELQLSGMIEIDSNLYSEIHKYFLNDRIMELPVGVDVAENIKQLPGHYFYNLIKLAQCVL